MMPSRLPSRASAGESATGVEERGRVRALDHAEVPNLEAVAVCRLAAAAGVRPRAAVGVIAEALPHARGAAVQDAATRLAAGLPLIDALDPEHPAIEPELARLLRILVAADTSGLDYTAELDSLLDDIRRDQLTRLEVGVGRLSVAMQFPIVLCILPAFVLLAIAPLVAATASQLGL